MKRIKWTIETARELFQSSGYILDDTEYINGKTKMICHDDNNYKYSCTLNDMQSGRKPLRFHISNPYTLDNINMFFYNNNSKTKVLSNEYISGKDNMEFQCECTRKFSCKLNNMIMNNKVYCNFCNKSKRYDGLRDYTQLIKDECERRGYELITDYIHRSNDEFEYICKKHKEYGKQISYYDRMINLHQGCKYCGIESRGIKHRTDESVFEKVAEEKGFKYIGCDYPRRKCGFTKARLHLICNKHPDKGMQYYVYENLVNNKVGCRYCAGYDRSKEDLQKEIDELGLDITILEYTSYTDLVCLCNKCGHIWENKGVNLTQGHGCPKCKRSKGELVIQKCLDKWGYEYTTEFKYDDCRDISPLPFDFHFTKSLVIEYDGLQHFIPVDFSGEGMEKAIENFKTTRRHDNIKSEFCVRNNITLIRISYDSLENGTLEEELYSKLKIYEHVVNS